MTRAKYIRTTPESLAVLCLEDAATEVARAAEQPVRWLFAITKLHRGLNCALVAALRGTTGTGAYREKGRERWITYFEQSRTSPVDLPDWDRVDTLETLLQRAQDSSSAADMGGTVLLLSEEQKADILLLKDLRDDIEHVKPVHWSVEVAGLPRIAGSVAAAMEQPMGMGPVSLHLKARERMAATRAIRQLRKAAESKPRQGTRAF